MVVLACKLTLHQIYLTCPKKNTSIFIKNETRHDFESNNIEVKIVEHVHFKIVEQLYFKIVEYLYFEIVELL